MIAEDLCKAIGKTAAAAAPCGWTRLWIIAEMESDNGQCLFDYETATEGRTWFAPTESDQFVIYKAFQDIRAAMLIEKASLWRVAKFSMEPDGKFHLDFEYES
jgi:hypothetical protein